MSTLNTFNPRTYRLFDVIGKGSFGKVYRSMDPEGKIVAIKMIDMDGGDIAETLQEITFLRKLNHKNVLSLYNAELVDSTVWLVTEYCAGGSLHRLLKSEGAFKESSACFVIWSMFNALSFTHSQGVIHRDIKPANVFIDGDGTLKLGDFGVSAQLTNTCPERNSLIGTPYWMAPEVISQSFYGPPADVWGVGIMAIELVTGKTPWSDIPPTRAMMMIVNDAAPILARSSTTSSSLLSANYVSLVRQCVVKDPANRATASEMLRMRWLSKYDCPPREFRHQVRDLIASQSPLKGKCIRVGPAPERVSDGTWVFDPTIDQPKKNASPSKKRSPKQSPSGSTTSPSKDYSDEFVLYFDQPLKAVEHRSKRPECKIMIAKVRMGLRRMDEDLNGLGRTLLEEAKEAEETSTPTVYWIDHIFQNAEKRSVKADVKYRLRLMRANLREIERQYPGFSTALTQEIKGRLKKPQSLM